MRSFIMFFMFILLVSPLYSQGDYVSVSFSQSTAVDTWANNDPSNVQVDVDVDRRYSNSSDSYTYDSNNNRYRVTTEYQTTDTTTTTTTTTTTADEVMFTMTFWDCVDANGAFSSQEEFENSWFQDWNANTSNAATANRNFQIRETSVDRAQRTQGEAEELNQMYSDLFVLQNQIDQLWNDCNNYRSNPEHDKQQPAIMDQLANLRKQEYILKGQIITQRAEVLSLFNEQDTGLKGWTVDTTVARDIDYTSSTVVTSVTETLTESGICFVADTQVVPGVSIEQLCGSNLSIWENNAEKTATVVRSAHYNGVVLMFYDIDGNALLPGQVTHNHVMVTADGQKRALEIMPGDKLMRGNNEIVTVGKVEVSLYNGNVYNVSNELAPFSFSNRNYVITCGVK